MLPIIIQAKTFFLANLQFTEILLCKDYIVLAEIPGVARDSRESERFRMINYGIIKKIFILQR
jgi:hypothetical protein